MTRKQPPESANTITTGCDVVIFGIRRTVLIKRNEEFLNSKKVKIKQNLFQYLLNDKVIKNFVQQLHEKESLFEGCHSD